MKNNGTAKHLQVRQAIIESIREGEFQPGERLPAERELAVQFGVSYMTARRAVTEMVEADLLVRRPREGTFIPSHTPPRLAKTNLQLVCPAFESSNISTFLRLGAQAAEARGWRADVIRLHREQVRPAVRAIENGDLAIVLPTGPELSGPLGEAMQRANGRAVLLGNRLDSLGVPSILADDAQGTRLAMNLLHEHNHRDIALLTDDPQHPIARVQIAAWRSLLDKNLSADARLIITKTPRHELQSQWTYQTIHDFLRRDGGQTTAILCLIDDMALPVLAACRAAGRAVPDKISLICAGNSDAMTYAYPPVTGIDVHIAEHIAQATEMLEAALQNQLGAGDLLRLIEPHLNVRESVACLNAVQ